MQAGGHREMPPGSVWSPEHDGGDDIVETEITPLRSHIQEDTQMGLKSLAESAQDCTWTIRRLRT